MANELADQLNTIERSLGECMIETASTVIRMWLNELGENGSMWMIPMRKPSSIR